MLAGVTWRTFTPLEESTSTLQGNRNSSRCSEMLRSGRRRERVGEFSSLLEEGVNRGDCSDVPHPRTGATALHVASAKGYSQIVELLLKAGCDVNAIDRVSSPSLEDSSR